MGALSTMEDNVHVCKISRCIPTFRLSFYVDVATLYACRTIAEVGRVGFNIINGKLMRQRL